MADRGHLSIGEVLSLVQEEFPDVTISKIRFLESQGLLDPERTPSGYRKFYDHDIERLAWILTQQRDNFLPLKVIRERLDEWDATGTHPERGMLTDTADAADGSDASGAASASDTGTGPSGHDGVSGGDAAHQDAPADPKHAAASLAAASAMEVISSPARPETPETPASAARAPEAARTVVAEDAQLRVGPPSNALTAEEIAAECGVAASVVTELESFGMIESRRIGPDTYFDPAAKVVIEACRSFLDHGVEVRHLRMYKIAAEREAGVLEQLVMPLLKQRNPEARSRAVETVQSLADVGETLHEALLRNALRDTLG